MALLPHVDLLLGPQVLALGLVALLALAPGQGALHGVAHPRAFGGAAGSGDSLVGSETVARMNGKTAISSRLKQDSSISAPFTDNLEVTNG